MSREPSKAELLELARDRIRVERYTAIVAVKEQIARLKETKNRAANEEGLEELPATTIFDITRVVLDSSCRVIDVGPGKCWSITFEGPDLLGNPLKVMAVLSKDENSVLVFTNFLPVRQ
jgi:hypothetical protein